MKRSHWLVVIGLAGLALRAEAQPPSEPTPATASYQMLDWEALLPPTERNQAAEPPAPVHDYLGEGDMAALQAGSSKTNSKLNQLRVKIPGFIVPLDNRPDGRVQEFFLVPYFGACIHVPPPPPNQIVYVKALAREARLDVRRRLGERHAAHR